MKSQSRFLSKAELKQRTGFTHRSCQISFLARSGIDFEINGKGELVVEAASASLARLSTNGQTNTPRLDRVPDGGRRGKTGRRPNC